LIRDKLLLDLDGVLVDLVLGISNALGKAWPYNDPKYFGEPHLNKVFDIDVLWDKLSPEFWANLPWSFDGSEILAYCEKRYEPKNICILTAPANEASAIGKMRWMERHLPYYHSRRQYFIGWQKDFMAEPRATLIDDTSDNTDLFSLRGGKAILVPRPWNRLHASKLTVVQTLEKFL